MVTRTAQQEIPKSSVSAAVAGLVSLVVPGLGQILARRTQRGLLLLGSIITIVGLGVWRIHTLGRLETGVLATLSKAFHRQPGFVVLVILGAGAAWLWAAWDAYHIVKEREKGGFSIFVLVLTLLFVLGWQIGEINLYTLATELPEASSPVHTRD